MMQDIAEQQDLAQEISDAISRPASDTFDEVNLLFHLFQLELELTFFFFLCDRKSILFQHKHSLAFAPL